MPAVKSVPRTRGKAMLEKMKSEDLDVTMTLIQELIPNGLIAAKEAIEKEVKRLTGERYKHGKENVSWGSQPGSIYLRKKRGQKRGHTRKGVTPKRGQPKRGQICNYDIKCFLIILS